MSLFNLDIPLKEKIVSHHPWEKIIEDKHAGKEKYAHNSVNNPIYPKKKKQKPDNDQLRFTIIGNMITQEFNYCVNLLHGMHKYRSKKFAAPVIKGITSVEWPGVWNDLKIRYGRPAHCLQSQVAILMNENFLGGEKELKDLIESKYVYHLTLDYYKEGIMQFAKFVKTTGRPFTFFHICIDKVYVGTMIFMLYDDILPRTCENFLRLCKDKRGGYNGTPVHRIVKDGWIQCGGYGLKDTKLCCENFIVPHDRRGVLCMANDGRHVNCSTQFFVLLQPAPWMAQEYVAFGQLVDGDNTLKKIECVPTWYESPKQEIIICQSGILNMDYHDVTICKKTREYINEHIDNLVVVGELFYEALLEKVFLEIEMRDLSQAEEIEEEAGEIEPTGNLRATARFMRNKDDIEKLKNNNTAENRRATNAENKHLEHEMQIEYEYESEELPSYQHVSLSRIASVEKPERPFYIPLTDVPYPGETDSTFDLKKFLHGDYCLESDLKQTISKKTVCRKRMSYSNETLYFYESSGESETSVCLDSEDERQIKDYLRNNLDRVSFAGSIIKGIAKATGKVNLLEDTKSIASTEKRGDTKKVFIPVQGDEKPQHKKIKRRHTGFVRAQDMQNIHHSDSDLSPVIDSTTGILRKVRISPATKINPGARVGYRPTGFFVPSDVRFDDDSNMQIHSPPVLVRLFDNIAVDEPGPTLKYLKPASEKNLLLKYSPNSRLKSKDSQEKYLRHTLKVDHESFEEVLKVQHGNKDGIKTLTRKISTDYAKTIGQIEHKQENSIRTLEFAKSRPCLSVSEYQMKNLKYKEEHNIPATESQVKIPTVIKPGLRLPGDSPLHSFINADQTSQRDLNGTFIQSNHI